MKHCLELKRFLCFFFLVPSVYFDKCLPINFVKKVNTFIPVSQYVIQTLNINFKVFPGLFVLSIINSYLAFQSDF